MGKYAYLLLLPAAFALSAGCVPPGKAAPAARAAQAASKKEPPLTAEQKKRVDQLYYRAVGAYSNNDMAAASSYIREILSICPSYKDALELREKVRLASGRK